MTKKFLCLMLCMALVLPTCIIPTAGIEPSGYTATSSVLYANDAEEAFENGIAATSISVSEATEDGNGYYVLKPLADGGVQVGLAMDDYLDVNQVFTFDLRSDNASSKSLKILCFNATRDARMVNVLINGLTADTWYTYKIEVAGAQDFTVQRKSRGAADSTYVTLAENSGWEKDTAGIGTFKGIYLGFRTSGGQYANTQYSIDNIMVADKGEMAASKATFVEDGEEVTPVFTTMGDCAPGSTAVAITAAYDADGNRVGVIQKQEVSLSTGISKVEAPMVECPQGGRVEAMLWNNETEMQPIAPVSVYGTEGSVDSSEATTATFSAKANKITVEGKYDTNALVTIKAVGDDDSLVYATQLKAKNDGSFKKVLPINYNGDVTVSVSALDEAAESSAFAMLNNWAAFKTAFESLDETTADNFFTDYADNFVGTLDVTTLDTEKREAIGSLVSIKEYTNITYAGILDEIYDIATNGIDEIDTFIDGVKDARILYTTNEAEAISDMKDLLSNVEIITFDRTSDVICRALLESPEETIEGLWSVYEDVKNEQATQESTQIPGLFAGIADAEGMESFFNETIEISGTPYTIKETLGLVSTLDSYTDREYAIMYGAYSELYAGYTSSTDYADVSVAIENLFVYTEKYKAWTAEVATKTTADDEWAAIKKAFDGTYAPVTAALADTYFSNETNAYKRITDMGYDSLEDAETDLATANAKIDFLMDLDAAKGNAAQIKALLLTAKGNGWITFEVSDSECARMEGWEGFNYFSDITAAYEFATGPDYAEYLIANGKSAELSLGDFSDESLIKRQEMTEGEDVFYRLAPDGVTVTAAPSFPYGAIVNSENKDLTAPNSVIELDVRFVEAGLPLSLVFPKAVGGDDMCVAIGLVPRELNKWYTYKLELGDYKSTDSIYDFLTVSVRERDNENSAYVILDSSVDIRANTTLNPSEIYGYDYTRRLIWMDNPTKIWVGYTTFRYGGADWTPAVFNATKTDVGPVMKAYQQAYIATSAAFEDAQGATLTRVPASGNVTPVFTVKNTGNDCFVDVVTVVYDKNGNMVDYKCEVRTVAKGEGTEISGPSVNAALAAGGGRIEAFVVDKADKMRPLGSAVLGTQPAVGTSELTDVTYSTYANKVTVEGTKSANEKLVLTVKDLSGNILAVTAFNAGADGKFKNTVAINPESYTSGTQVKVMLSTASGKEEETIAMSSGFNAMKTALNSSASDIAGSFFDDFANCFRYFDNEGTVKYALEVTPGNKDDMVFLVNTFRKAKAFESMTSEEIISKLIEIYGAIVDGSVAQFVSDMNAANGDAARVSELLTSENTAKFIAFDQTGVSNVGEIAENMVTTGATIQDIHAAFETAKNDQKDLESGAVSDFKSIADANAMETFFATHATNLGTVTYSSADSAVMYNVYTQKNYLANLQSADDETVIEAIKFVQNYVNEYKAWTSAINSSQTATAEWNAIKEVFGTLDFVTPALVDGNKAEERVAKVYKRIVDLYPAASARSASVSTLVEVASRLDDDLSVIEEKLACIDATAQAATTPNGEITGYWGRVKEQVVLASTTKGWITLNGSQGTYEDAVYNKMLGKAYRYFSEIVAAYNAAVPTGGTGGGNGGGGGTGGGGITSGTGNSLADIPDNITIVDGTTGNNGTITGGNVQDYPVAPFVDITDEYAWAEASISGLRRYGIVRGDGDGSFRPGDGISREEFLALLLRIFEIETKETKANFSDVKKNEWYYGTVATAYEMGIVNGYTDGRFGIGDKISRADMSVMVCRTLDIMGKAPDAENVGFVFTDYLEIPDYAYNAVARLQQMGLVQGDSYRRFNPNVNLTRAEAAVVLWPIFKQAGDMIQ